MKKEKRKLWNERIDDYRTSGLTATEWAESKGISVHQLRYYINKFNKEKKESIEKGSLETKWASVIPKETKPETKLNNPVNIVIGKARIEVASGFDEDAFQSVVRILSQC